MSFLKNIFKKKETPINSYADFWEWFQTNEKKFSGLVQQRRDLEDGFFNKLSSKLIQLKDIYFFLCGMVNENTAELIFTADGNVSNIVFVEELVAAAPSIQGWKFTALKRAVDIEKMRGIEMSGILFSAQNLNFCYHDSVEYPDKISIIIVHDDYNENIKDEILRGVFIYLDNYLGELDVVNLVDELSVAGKHQVQSEIIPIAKLKDFLVWKQKEFIEKYDGIRYNTENDQYAVLKAQLDNGNELIAVINSDILNWDSKASHPWISVFRIEFDGSKNNGMPDEEGFATLGKIEDEIMQQLIDSEGCLNIGRETADGVREIFFACKDFRKPSKVFYEFQKLYSNDFKIDYDIYKDKYWQSFERYQSE